MWISEEFCKVGGRIVKLLVKAPAKINLSLDVLYKRPDGYHEVEMIMTTIDLADRVELTLLDENKIIFFLIIGMYLMTNGI